MVRYPDILKVYRHTGDIYDPFSKPKSNSDDVVEDAMGLDIQDDDIEAEEPDSDAVEETEIDPTISEELVYVAECNHQLSSQNHMMSVADKGTYTIIVPDVKANIDTRDTAFLYINGEGNPLRMTILEVTPYSRNLVLHAMHLKDGDNGV